MKKKIKKLEKTNGKMLDELATTEEDVTDKELLE